MGAIFSVKDSLLKQWFNDKGFSGSVNDAMIGYFASKSGLVNGTLHDHMIKTLNDLGYTTGRLQDKLTTFFTQQTSISYRWDAERQFFNDPSKDFDFGGPPAGTDKIMLEGGVDALIQEGGAGNILQE